MFSLGRLATGLALPADDVESTTRGTASDATTALPIDERNTTAPSSRARSTAPSMPSTGSSAGPCLTAATQTTLGNVPRALPPSASAAGLKGLPLQLITTALSVGPTLLPPHLANLITALALSMRVSLRATAFFVEAILESCKYGTAASLGLTRRALIAAVSSARTVYAVREGLDWAGDKLGALKGDDPFLSVLDKYTNLGIYLITHTFTLAELFAMSGFYLTSTAVHTGITAAQESVALFDGIFGSNESSRALSSIITLIRTEVLHDKRLTERKMGTVRSLTALTKALTAYACLQLATRRRYADAGKQNKVLFDCTVVGQLNEDSSGRIDVEHETPSPRAAGADSDPDHPHHSWTSPSGSRAPSYEPPYLLTDVRSALEHQQSQQSSAAPQGASTDDPGTVPEPVSQNAADEALVRQLEELVGDDPEEYIEGGQRRRRWVEHDEHEAYYEITEQVTEQVTETQTIEHYKAEDYQRLRQPGLKPPLAAAVADDDEWIEVDNGLVLQPDNVSVDLHDGHRSTSSSHIRLVALESSPNGQPAPSTTTIASRAYSDAMDNPQESSARVQVILKTITRRLLQKKRTVKRVRGHSPGLPPPVPRNTLRQADPGESAPGLMDIDWSAAQDESETQDGRSAQDELREVEDMISCPTSDADAPVTPSAIIGPAGEQLYPDVTGAPAVRHRVSSSSVSPPAMPVRLSSAPLITPKKPKRQGSSLSSTSSPSSTPPPMNSLSRALVRAKGKFQTRSPKADVTSPSGSAYPSSSDVNMSSRSPSRPPSRPVAPKPPPPPKSSVLFPPRQSVKHRQRSPPPAPSANAPRDRRTRHESVTSTRTQESHSQYHSSAQAPPSDEASPAALFPRDHLVKNIHKFCRFSSAAYGQNFLRVLGLGSTDFMFPSGGRYHPNTWAFAQHTNLPIECMLLSSYVDPGPALSHEKLNPLVHYIAVDHAAKAIVLTCRGTLGLSDVLVDLCCEYEQIEVEGGDSEQTYLAHSGMLFSARKLMSSSSTVHETVRKALEDYPTYGLVLTGHSLGGGAAALLSILWSCPSTFFDAHVASLPGATASVGQRTPFVTNFSSGLPSGRPIHCYTYGCPSVASADLATHAKGLISSVVQNNDIVPTLSLGILRDFKNIAVTLSDEGSVTKEIVGRVVGLHQRRLRNKYGPALLQSGVPDVPPPEPLRPDVRLSAEEIRQGHSRNYADDRNYRDPARAASPERDVPSEQQLLDDWLFSLYKTLRADMSSEKLYPAGTVYNMEHWEVYLNDSTAGSDSPTGPKRVLQKEAHRVVLRAVDDVPRRFGELTFAKSMLNDHLPTNYEKGTALLYQGLFGS